MIYIWLKYHYSIYLCSKFKIRQGLRQSENTETLQNLTYQAGTRLQFKGAQTKVRRKCELDF